MLCSWSEARAVAALWMSIGEGIPNPDAGVSRPEKRRNWWPRSLIAGLRGCFVMLFRFFVVFIIVTLMTLLLGQIVVNFWWLNFRRSEIAHYTLRNLELLRSQPDKNGSLGVKIWNTKFGFKRSFHWKILLCCIFNGSTYAYADWKSRETIGNRILIMYDFHFFPGDSSQSCTTHCTHHCRQLEWLNLLRYKQDFFLSYRNWSEIDRDGLRRGIPPLEEFKMQKQKCAYYLLSHGRDNSSP